MTAAIYRTQVSHVRNAPLRNAFRYRSTWWLVDVDDLPTLPLLLRPFVRIEPRDHLGAPERTLRQNVEDHLATEGVDLRGGRVDLLTSPRSLGHVFNPMSVFWCHDADGSLLAVLVEVHNTYGGRHVYTVRTDERGRAATDKVLYVSPFYPVDGHYTMSLPEPGRHLRLGVTLHRDGDRPFTASVTGTRRPATTVNVVRTLAASPVETLRVVALIRWQGIRLWLRGLRVRPRPDDSDRPTSSPTTAMTTHTPTQANATCPVPVRSSR